MQDQRVQTLADTLKCTGLCYSTADALRMAQNILGTEQKLASAFDKFNEPKKTKSYEEEIEELIRKTSPENKNYHCPVKGYKKEVFYELEEPLTNDTNNERMSNVKNISETSKLSVSEDSVFTDLPIANQSVKEVVEVKEVEPEFIIPLNAETDEKNKVEQNVEQNRPKVEQMFTEIKEEKSSHPKNPIESVDLMNYFKAV